MVLNNVNVETLRSFAEQAKKSKKDFLKILDVWLEGGSRKGEFHETSENEGASEDLTKYP